MLYRVSAVDLKIISKEDIRLIYAGRSLEDGRLCHDYGINNEHTIHMVLRLNRWQNDE